MVARAGLAHESQIARQHDLLTRRRPAAQAKQSRDGALVHYAGANEIFVLAMLDERQAQWRGVLHRQPHHAPAAHRPPIVGEGDRAGLGQFHHLGQLAPLLAARDRRDGPYPRRSLLRAVTYSIKQRRRVEDGIGVGHAANRREAAARRRPRASGDRLLALVARLAQVRVEVHEARRDDPASRRLDHTRVTPLGGERRAEANRRHPLALDQRRAWAVESLAGIEDATGAQEQELSHAPTVPPVRARAPPAAPCAPRRRWSPAPRSLIADPRR